MHFPSGPWIKSYGPVSNASGLSADHVMVSLTYGNDTIQPAEKIEKKLDHQDVV